MRLNLKYGLGLVCLAALFALVPVVAAQGPTVRWTFWNAQITAHANSSQLEVAESQSIRVTNGTLNAGERDYSQPVNIQSVYVALNGGQPTQLTQGSGTGMYQVSNANGDVVLKYRLPSPANSGDQFVVQINFTVNQAAAGVINWDIVPGTHAAQVDSSTVTINFPDGGAPSADQVRVVKGVGTAAVSGSSIVVRSQGALAANQPFEVQLPYGANVPVAGNSGNTGSVNDPNIKPVTGNTSQGLGLGISLPVLICGALCLVGIFLFLSATGLLRGLMGGGLLGGLLGGIGRGSSVGRGGGIFGGGNSGGGGIFGGGNSGGGGGFSGGGGNAGGGRGFRESGNQNREVPPVNNDKQSGGGGSFS